MRLARLQEMLVNQPQTTHISMVGIPPIYPCMVKLEMVDPISLLTSRNIVSNLWIFLRLFSQYGVPQNGWFIWEKPIKMHDLGVPPVKEILI